jgi:hypothetical protein
LEQKFYKYEFIMDGNLKVTAVNNKDVFARKIVAGDILQGFLYLDEQITIPLADLIKHNVAVYERKGA